MGPSWREQGAGMVGVPSRRYRRRRGSRAPGAGGRRAQAGRAAAGRTRSRRGRGSGGRGRPAGRNAPGAGPEPRPPAAGSPRRRLQERARSGVPREAAEAPRSLPGGSARGLRLLPGHCGQHSSGTSTGSGQGSGGQRRARHCTLPLCNRETTPGSVSGGRQRGSPLLLTATLGGRCWSPKSRPSSPGRLLPRGWGWGGLTRQRHCRQGSEG